MGFLIMLAAFFVLRRMMWHRGWQPRYMHRHYGRPRLWQIQPYAMQRLQPAPVLSPRQQRERAMIELRRRYGADEIDVEEYERGLDQILRKS